MELLQTMGLAFLGGLILNIMPCVLPVLTMKIFGLVEHSGASAAENRKNRESPIRAGFCSRSLSLQLSSSPLRPLVSALGGECSSKTRHSSRRLPG